MSATSLSLTRRDVLATAAAAGAVGLPPATLRAATEDNAIRPFRIAPRSWAKRNYHNLIYWSEVDKGGHFAAWEQPDLFATEIRAAFRSLR